MQYYLKNPISGDIEGPFSTERLNAMIVQSTIDSRFLATSNIGESPDQLKRQRNKDWVSLGDIPGIVGIPSSEITRPQGLSMETKIALVLIVLIVLALALWWLLKAGIASGLSDS